MSIITTGQLVHWKNKQDIRPVQLGDRFNPFLLGFKDWSYQSPVAAQWRNASYTSPQALELARHLDIPGLTKTTRLPIYLVGVDSIRKLLDTDKTGRAELGRNKLMQFILLVRLALTDPDRHNSFGQYLDAASVDLVLHEIASWPMDNTYIFVTQSY